MMAGVAPPGDAFTFFARVPRHMTLLKQHAAPPSESPAHGAAAPDWQALYQTMMAQLMANMEGMVAHALAAQIGQHGLAAAAARPCCPIWAARAWATMPSMLAMSCAIMVW